MNEPMTLERLRGMQIIADQNMPPDRVLVMHPSTLAMIPEGKRPLPWQSSFKQTFGQRRQEEISRAKARSKADE